MNKLESLLNLATLLSGEPENCADADIATIMIGKKVIVRTYSAGNWYGTLSRKAANEVVLSDARRMYRWFAAKGITLSEVATFGVVADKSKICAPVSKVWLQAIEIIPATQDAIEKIEGCPHATP